MLAAGHKFSVAHLICQKEVRTTLESNMLAIRLQILLSPIREDFLGHTSLQVVYSTRDCLLFAERHQSKNNNKYAQIII